MNANVFKQEINKSKRLTTSTPPNTPIASISESFYLSQSMLPIHKHYLDHKRVLDNWCEGTDHVEHSIACNHYKPIAQISQTLQGSIWKVSKNENTYIIKVTNKLLHNKHITNWNGEQIHISEDIIQEAKILKYLTCNNPPKSLAKKK
eukprot:127956_1